MVIRILLVFVFLASVSCRAEQLSMDGLSHAGGIKADNRFSSQFIRVMYIPHDSLYGQPVDIDIYNSLPTQWKRKIDIVINDETISRVAKLVVSAAGRGSRRVRNVFSPRVEVVLSGDADISHFNDNQVVLARHTIESSSRVFRAVLVHELGHALHHCVCDGWTPSPRYRSADYVSGADTNHSLAKITRPSTAWLEGFAEAMAAYFVSDRRVVEFSARKDLLYDRNYAPCNRDSKPEPASLDRLNATEGYVAGVLFDLWQGPGCFSRTLDVMKDHRHKGLVSFLSDYLAVYGGDELRVELVLQGNCVPGDASVRKAGLAPCPMSKNRGILCEALARLQEAYGSEKVAAAIVELLHNPSFNTRESVGIVTAKLKYKVGSIEGPVFRVTLDDPSVLGDTRQEQVRALEKKIEREKYNIEHREDILRGLLSMYGWNGAKGYQVGKDRLDRAPERLRLLKRQLQRLKRR